MSLNAQNLINLIDQYVRNYAPDSFMNLRMNSILKQLVAMADGASGGTVISSNIVPVTSANFINSTDCPLTALAGANLQIFWSEGNRYIEKDLGEWTDLGGGGFRILIPDFDSTVANYHFKVFVQ